MRRAFPQASERRVCRLLDVPRSSLRSAPAERRLRRPLDTVLVERIRELIRRHPTFGYRKLWALCVWQHNFASFIEARAAISQWIRWYNERRPHQALGYLSPHQYRAQQLQAVA